MIKTVVDICSLYTVYRNCSGFKVQWFRVDVRPEPSLADNQANCVHPLASLAYQPQIRLRFAPLESGRSYQGGQVEAGQCRMNGMVATLGRWLAAPLLFRGGRPKAGVQLRTGSTKQETLV